jgi:hypothetical protein
MGFDGSGNYTRTNGTLSGSTLWTQRAAQANPIISATEHDAEMNDVATALTDCVKANGSKAATGNQPMAGFKHTGVGSATASDQYTTLGQINTSLATGSLVITDAAAQVNVGSAATSTQDNWINVGQGRTGSGNSFIDLIGDTTYTDYGCRLIRNGGANSNSELLHRGTGNAVISAVENGAIVLATNGADRLKVDANGARIGDNQVNSTSIAVGYHRATGGTAQTSFITGTGNVNDALLRRNSGTNGTFEIINQGSGATIISGDGEFQINTGAAPFSFDDVNGLQIADNLGEIGGYITTNKDGGNGTKLRIFGSRGSGGVVIRTNNSGTIADRVDVVDAGHLQPVTDNALTLGASGYRWKEVWAGTGAILTSDERTKKDIADSSLGLAFVKALRPVSYKWVEGSKEVTGQVDGQSPTTVSVPGQRTHFGLIAQEVKAAIPEGVDFGGWVLTDKNDPNSQQALRYDQFIAPLIQAVKELSAKVEVLEAKVAALEGA